MCSSSAPCVCCHLDSYKYRSAKFSFPHHDLSGVFFFLKMCTCSWQTIFFTKLRTTFRISSHHLLNPALNEYAWRREKHFTDYRRGVRQVTGKLCFQSGVPVWWIACMTLAAECIWNKAQTAWRWILANMGMYTLALSVIWENILHPIIVHW